MSYYKPRVKAVNTSSCITTGASITMGALGTIVGGANAAARNIVKVKQGEIDQSQAISQTAKEAVGTGVATGVATAVVTKIGPRTTFWTVVGVTTVAVGTKLVWDSFFKPQKKAAPAAESIKEPEPKEPEPKEPEPKEPESKEPESNVKQGQDSTNVKAKKDNKK